ncbi:MAG: sulfatase [Planctomycetota bacterium]
MVRKSLKKAETHLAPNFLIVLLDTATADLLSCYGRYKNTTPRFDRLAEEGTRFANAYTSGPWTPPSHAALFSGQPSIYNGITHDAINIENHLMFEKCKWSGKFPTLASTLSQNGYDTVGVCANSWVGSKSNICWGFDYWIENIGAGAQAILKKTGQEPNRHASTTNLLYWMDEKRSEKKPWFCFVNYATPHLKRCPKPEFQKKFVKGRVPQYLHEINSGNCFEYLWNGILKKKDMHTFIMLYVALAAQVDWEIEEMLTGMEQRGLLDNTVVFLVSDHGDENAEHNLLDHQMCVYNTLIHIPMIAWGPGRIPEGMVVENNAQMLDIFPTILDLAGLHPVREKLNLPGMNLMTEAPHRKEERLIVSEHGVPKIIADNAGRGVDPKLFAPYMRQLKCAIEGDWKYIWGSDGRDELYNMRKDPVEQDNLINRNRATAQALKRKLAAWCKSYGKPLKLDGMSDKKRLQLAEWLWRHEYDKPATIAYMRAWAAKRAGQWP